MFRGKLGARSKIEADIDQVPQKLVSPWILAVGLGGPVRARRRKMEHLLTCAL